MKTTENTSGTDPESKTECDLSSALSKLVRCFMSLAMNALTHESDVVGVLSNQM